MSSSPSPRPSGTRRCLAAPQCPVHLVTDRAAKALSDTVTPAGLVAVCEMPATRLEDVLAGSPRLVVVRRRDQRAWQRGTVIRIADAMGAAAVILGGHSVDPYNGKCLRASAGSIFSIPVVVASDAHAAVSALRAAGLQVLATTVDGETSLDEARPRCSRRRGCSGLNHTACRPRSPTRQTIGCASRCPAARKA